MSDFHTIKINHNSDCWGELDALKTLLRGNTGYSFEQYSNAEIVAIAVDELYNKLVADKKSGKNQRKGVII